MSDPLHIVCPSCHSINRVPAVRLSQQPGCGKCHRPLFTGHPVELEASTWSRQISQNGIPVLVDFWAPWCGPCKTMAPQFSKAASLLEPYFRLAKVNTDDQPALGTEYGIRSIPTLMLFMNGRELARQSGAMMANDIVSWAKQLTR